MRVLVSGTRNGSVAIEKVVFEELSFLHKKYPLTLFLILGDANGVDQYARNFAELNKVDHVVLYAKWDEYGKSAGPIRNNKMFEFDPQYVVAIPSKDSVGTTHVIEESKDRGIKPRVVMV